ncbi:uncharacterized protein LOC126375743 [Pectinophora gossypiella]|uniref:uncharacterized protein LOC126375743 n=1 Tax=Pectinophora gossypiella TaxID=13191 RepID=UPI00214EDC7F|nr:uncharacterized protein LOC126375743 [Pectinophora gossypiella]
MAPTSKLGRGKALKNQTKEVLHKIYTYFETEIERDPNSTVTAAQLVAHSTGVSTTAIKRLLSEYNDKVTVKKEHSTTTKRKIKKVITSDDFDSPAIRKVIHGFYNRDEEFPVMKDLYLIMKGDIDYQRSLCTLRRDVAKLGFKWMEKEDNNSILIEKHELRFARVQYLTRIENYRAQGRNIVYTGEVAIESSRISSKPKPDGSSIMLKQPAKSRLILLLAGDQSEVYKDTLFMYDGNKRDVNESECKKENFEQMEKWFKYHVIPTLKANSVVVVDGGSAYHNRVSNPVPHSNSKRKEMMDYLTARNVPFTENMYKSQLYQLVQTHKDKFLDYKTDALLREQGHIVLRLPPHHKELSPIKNILTLVRNYVGQNRRMSMESVMKISKEKVLSFHNEDWNIACREVEAEENNLKATDKLIDEISESSIKKIEGDSEVSDQEEIDSDSDSD